MTTLLNNENEINTYLDALLTGQNLKTNDVAFVFGAGVNMAMGMGVSWNGLNIELLKVLEEIKAVDKFAHMQWLNGSKVSSFDEAIVSEYIKSKFKNVSYEKYTESIDEILRKKSKANAAFAKFSVAHTNSLIITTNYLLHDDIEREREIVTDDKTDKNSVGKKTIYVHGRKDRVVLSKEDFAEKYYDKKSRDKLEKLLWSNVEKMKYIFVIGASGKDYEFFNVLAKVNKNATMILFSEDYFSNPREASVFDDMMRTLYSIDKVVHYPNGYNLSQKIITEIGNRLTGNQQHSFGDFEFLKIRKKYIQGNYQENMIDWIYLEANKKGKFSLDDFSNFISNLKITFKTFNESKINVFTKQHIFQALLKNKKATKSFVKWFAFEGTNMTWISGDSWASLFDDFLNSNRIDVQTKMKLIEKYISEDIWEKDYVFNVDQYCLTLKVERQIRTIRNDKKIMANIKSFDDIEKILSTYIFSAKWPETDILNMDSSTFGGVAAEIRENICNFFSKQNISKDSAQTFARELSKNANGSKDVCKWVLYISSLFKHFSDLSIDVDDIWVSSHDVFAKNLGLLKEGVIVRLKINNPKASEEIVKIPDEYFYYGMLSKNKEWLEAYKKSGLINSYKKNVDKIEEAISSFDLEKFFAEIDELRRSWTSRKFGDGTLDFDEKNLSTLLKQDPWDFWHVYESWVKNPNIGIDQSTIDAFQLIKSIDLKNYDMVMSSCDKSIASFVKSRIKEIIQNGASQKKLKAKDISFFYNNFVSLANDDKTYKKADLKKNEPFAILYSLSFYSFCELIVNQFFDKENVDDDKRLAFKKALFKHIPQSESTISKELILISFSWYWNPRYFLDVMEKFPKNKMEIINVVNSSINFWDVETNSKIVSVILENQESPILKNKSDVGGYNAALMFYLANRSQEAIDLEWTHHGLISVALSWQKYDSERNKIFDLLVTDKLKIKRIPIYKILESELKYSEIKVVLYKLLEIWKSNGENIHDFGHFFEITNKWKETQCDKKIEDIFNEMSEKVRYNHIYIPDGEEEAFEKNIYWIAHVQKFGKN